MAVTASIWDDPAIKPEASTYQSWENVGDSLEGTIATITKHTWADGTSAPKFTFVEDGVPNLTASQTVLKSNLFNLRPVPGEKLFIQFTRVVKNGSKTPKFFHVKVTAVDGTVRTAGDEPGPGF